MANLAAHGDNNDNNAAVGQEAGALEALVQLTGSHNEGVRYIDLYALTCTLPSCFNVYFLSFFLNSPHEYTLILNNFLCELDKKLPVLCGTCRLMTETVKPLLQWVVLRLW